MFTYRWCLFQGQVVLTMVMSINWAHLGWTTATFSEWGFPWRLFWIICSFSMTLHDCWLAWGMKNKPCLCYSVDINNGFIFKWNSRCWSWSLWLYLKQHRVRISEGPLHPTWNSPPFKIIREGLFAFSPINMGSTFSGIKERCFLGNGVQTMVFPPPGIEAGQLKPFYFR